MVAKCAMHGLKGYHKGCFMRESLITEMCFFCSVSLDYHMFGHINLPRGNKVGLEWPSSQVEIVICFLSISY